MIRKTSDHHIPDYCFSTNKTLTLGTRYPYIRGIASNRSSDPHGFRFLSDLEVLSTFHNGSLGSGCLRLQTESSNNFDLAVVFTFVTFSTAHLIPAELWRLHAPFPGSPVLIVGFSSHLNQKLSVNISAADWKKHRETLVRDTDVRDAIFIHKISPGPVKLVRLADPIRYNTSAAPFYDA